MNYQSPYEYFGNTLCVRAPFLFKETDIITEVNYKNLTQRGNLRVVKAGKGKGNQALIEFESMRPDLKEKVIQFEKPETLDFNWLHQYFKFDQAAISFFANYTKADGRGLSPQKQKMYCTNALILNAAREFERRNIARHKRAFIWETISDSINSLDKDQYTFKLPTNSKVLRKVFDEYVDKGYNSLVHGGEGNNNSRKVHAKLETLILSIYCMKNKPFSSTVQQIYLQFLGGSIDIVDTTTGELFDPSEFEKDGKPIVISDSTVWNYLNDPKNRILVDKYRAGSLEFNNTHRPHHHRHAPMFSLSKISLDDRDLPRKMLDGKRVKAYYAYDVTSGCVIGASYSKDKDTRLFIDCIRDMLRFLNRSDLGIPMEVEVEHHIVNQFKYDLMKAGTAFPFVRWCNPGNSQEKRAEHFNKAKKYGYEKRYQEGIGRWYAKSEAHRTSVEKVFDGENNNFKEKKYEYEFLVADDREIIEKYNNDLHPNQKKYKGMTRLDVLKHNLNPNLAKFDEVIWARYVGDCTNTTIRRSQYVQVQHAKYQLPSPEVLQLLAPNNYEVQAYYLRNESGDITRVFIYQDDHFIAECEKLQTYNEATSEHTDQDRELINSQSAYVAKFDKHVKEGKKVLARVELLAPIKTQIPLSPEENIVEHRPIEPEDKFAQLLKDFDEEYIIEKAKKQI